MEEKNQLKIWPKYIHILFDQNQFTHLVLLVPDNCYLEIPQVGDSIAS